MLYVAPSPMTNLSSELYSHWKELHLDREYIYQLLLYIP